MAEVVLKSSLMSEVATKSDGIPILLPSFQSQATIGMNSYYEVPIQPSAPTNAFSQGASVKYDLEVNDVEHIKRGYFRIKLKNNGVTAMGTPYLFDYLEIRHSKAH